MKTLSSRLGISFALALGAVSLPALAETAGAATEAAPPAGVVTAPAPPFMPGPGGCGAWLQGRAAARLGLSDAQRASFQAIFAKHQASLASKRQAADEARQAYWEAVRKPDTDPDTLRRLHRTLSDQAFEAQLEQRALRQELHAVLTPEQRERAAWMEGRMAARMGGRNGGRGGAGYGPMARARWNGCPMVPVAPGQ